MMSVLEELEALAQRYAHEAIRYDKAGATGVAIAYYQKAVDALLRMVEIAPDHPLSQVYVEKATTYQERIKALQSLELRPQFEGVSEGVRGRGLLYAEEQIAPEDLILREKPSIRWSDVANLEEAKDVVTKAIIYPSKRPDLFPLGWPRGILFFGPPGCGKTLLAAAVASEIDAHFFSVDAASIMSKWLGEAEKNVSKLFGTARRIAESGEPVIIFIDEIDSLFGIHASEIGGEVRVRNQFLKEIDGLLTKGRKEPLYLIGATNKPWTLDRAFIRRFEKRVLIPLPNLEARVELFRIHTRGLRLSEDVDFWELAKLTEGFSGSDIRDVCQEVQVLVVRELFEAGLANDASAKPRPICMEDFKKALSKRKPSVSPEMARAYEDWNQIYGAL